MAGRSALPGPASSLTALRILFGPILYLPHFEINVPMCPAALYLTVHSFLSFGMTIYSNPSHELKIVNVHVSRDSYLYLRVSHNAGTQPMICES